MNEPHRTHAGRASLFAASLTVGSVACLFRVVTFYGLPNDQFVLAAAQAIGAGDWPVRDFTEGGAPLQELLSAIGQTLLGPGPFPELMLTVVALGLAAAVTCWVAARLTGSIALGVFAAVQQVVVCPLLYGFPKILIYPVLFLIGWAYLRRPSIGRLAGLGLWTAIAFLFRHDHGVYSAIGGAAAVVLAHWPDGIRTIARRAALYAVIVVCGIAPYLAYVDRYLGIVDYFETGMTISRTQARNEDWDRPRLEPVRGGPPLVIRPRPAEHLSPIAVRWRAGLSEAARHDREHALGLLYPELRDDGRSWRYRIELPATDTLRALVESPDAEDTAGFDRQTFVLADPPSEWSTILVVALALDRVTWGPPLVDLFTFTNATAIMWYAVWLLPPFTLLIWMVLRRSADTSLAGLEVLLLVAIAVPTIAGFVRAPTVTRIPDAFGTAPLLSAWVLAALWSVRPHPAVLRVALKVLALGLAMSLVVAQGVMGDVPARLRMALPGGFGTVPSRVRTVVSETRTWPWTGDEPDSATTRLARYVNRCTTADDRLLVTWYAPELNFQSQRVFAGGEMTLASPQRPPSTYEGAVLERLTQQSVPIVLSLREEQPQFDAAFPRIAAYLAERYRTVDRVTEEGAEYSILVDRLRQPVGTDPQLGLPCFVR
jgi:hypothetical protein